MKQRMHGLGIALLVVLFAAGPLTLFAQQDQPLDKKVTLKVDHERLEDVLNELAKKGYITFSYKSDIVDKDRLITLTLNESTFRAALEQILGKAYDYIASDDYVVIRRPAVRAKGEDDLPPNLRNRPKKGVSILATDDSDNLAVLKQKVRSIIEEMIGDGIVKDYNSLTWFALDDGQFILDGN